MLRFFKTYRSAGIKVAASLHRLIAAANHARDAGEWRTAADLYGRVLARRPDLVHLRVQQGHALKEDGRWEDAAGCYRQAMAVAPDDRDAALHLAHTLKVIGDFLAAAKLYVALALRDVEDEEAMREARDLLAHLPDDARRTMAVALSVWIGAAPAPPADADRYPPLADCALVFDVCDLVSYFSHSRRPTGIQRVQIEVLTQTLRESPAGRPVAGVCCFIDGRDCWVEVPPTMFLEVLRLSGAPGSARDPAWRRRRDELHLHLLVTDPVEFRARATLINLGTSWWLQNYFLALRDVQARRGIVYVPMIHDMIPVVLPEFCLEPMVRDFIGWISGIFDHSTTFIANSEATKRDLLSVAAAMGRPLSLGAVAVVRLDALPSSVDDGVRDGALPAAVDGRPFVLFVATIEPRKGHIAAFDAWERLVEQLGPGATPQLVCVGRKGWHDGPILKRLADSTALLNCVTLLADLDEATLAALYEQCLFVIYPSLYEGWGLPVTEALARGKPVITTTSSSLPEAGGDLARYVPPGDAEALAEAAADLILDAAGRAALAARIARDFAPRSWSAIAAEIDAVATKLGALPEARRRHQPPVASLDRYHPIGRSMATRLHLPVANGEGFRSGRGWLTLEEWGCRVAEEGGELAFTLPPEAAGGEALTIAICLRAPDHMGCSFRVDTVGGDLAPGERRTVLLPLATQAGGSVTITIVGAVPDSVPRATIGMEGFAIGHSRD